MKASTLRKRLDERYKGSKTSIAYRIVSDLINGTNKTYKVYDYTIRPCHTSGKGRYTSNLDYTKPTEAILNLIGLKYKSGNDAPRGGLTGNFILILTKIERK